MSERARRMRDAFDASFARELPDPVASIPLLAIEIGREPLALRASEIQSIQRLGRVRSLPGAPEALLGLTGIHGKVVPVYDLGALLGRSAVGTPRWVVLTGSPPLGLAFTSLEGQREVPRADVAPPAAPERFVHAIARMNGGARAVLDLASLWQEVRARAARGGHVGDGGDP